MNGNTKWSSYRIRAAEKISYHIGRLYRGYIARRMIHHYLWKQYDNAARIIQSQYKLWKNKQNQSIIEARIRMSKLSFTVKRLKFHSDISFRKLVHGDGSHEDQMVIRRLLIDLRRAYPSHSIENCMKAIVESKGDANRAITLLGLPAFTIRYKEDLPPSCRDIFISTKEGTKTKTTSTIASSTSSSKIKSSSKISSNNNRPKSAKNVHRQNSVVQGIRNLKSYKESKKAQSLDLDSEISNCLETIYLSKNTFNNRITIDPLKFTKIYSSELV